MLVGWTDELITLPNRLLANSQIANFSLQDRPVIRSQNFRLPYNTDRALARKCLLESLRGIPHIRSWPEPFVLISEMNESWLMLKLGYFIENFGAQYSIADAVLDSALQNLKAHGIEPAPARLMVDANTRPSGSVAQ